MSTTHSPSFDKPPIVENLVEGEDRSVVEQRLSGLWHCVCVCVGGSEEKEREETTTVTWTILLSFLKI